MYGRNRSEGWKHAKLSGHENEELVKELLDNDEKYTREFNTKKQALEKDYNTRLSNIEKSIQTEIEKKAQKDKYDYVFAKSVVLIELALPFVAVFKSLL